MKNQILCCSRPGKKKSQQKQRKWLVRGTVGWAADELWRKGKMTLAQSLSALCWPETAAAWLPDSCTASELPQRPGACPPGALLLSPESWLLLLGERGPVGKGSGTVHWGRKERKACSRPLWKPRTELSRKYAGVLTDELLKCPSLCGQHQVSGSHLLE